MDVWNTFLISVFVYCIDHFNMYQLWVIFGCLKLLIGGYILFPLCISGGRQILWISDFWLLEIFIFLQIVLICSGTQLSYKQFEIWSSLQCVEWVWSGVYPGIVILKDWEKLFFSWIPTQYYFLSTHRLQDFPCA